VNLSTSKHNLRQEAKTQRKGLSDDELEYCSIQIAKQVNTCFSFRDKQISCFLSMEAQREVRTESILKQLAMHNQLFVPVSNFLDDSMQLVPFEPGDILVLNSYHIPEPIHKKNPIDPIELDVIFIPLLQADVQGNRLGYGKGFYDRYLALCRPDVIKIGLNFFEPIPAIPAEKTDISLDYLITPNRVYEFK
jgi:5-formyltetrahydrofolate cyclo-ligase